MTHEHEHRFGCLDLIEEALIGLVVFTGLILSKTVDPMTAIIISVVACFVLPLFRSIRNRSSVHSAPRVRYGCRAKFLLAVLFIVGPIAGLSVLPYVDQGFFQTGIPFYLMMLVAGVGFLAWAVILMIGKSGSSGETHGHSH